MCVHCAALNKLAMPSSLLGDSSSSLTCTGYGVDESINVVISPENVRMLRFTGDPPGWQSAMQCAGPPPKLPTHGRCDDASLRASWSCALPDTSGDPILWYFKRLVKKLEPVCESKPNAKVLMLGLGGGAVQTYIANRWPGMSVITVEKNPSVVAAARDFFWFQWQRLCAGRSCSNAATGENWSSV